MSQRFSEADVATHNKPESLYIIVDQDVYDVTQFADEHPGGKKILQRVGGKDASKQFWKYHNEAILKKYQKKLKIGSLNTKPEEPKAEESKVDAAKQAMVDKVQPNQITAHEQEEAVAMDPYGDLVPFADPNWYQSYHSAYWNETHATLRAEVREWVEEVIIPNTFEWDEAKRVPEEIYQELGKRGYLAGLMGGHFPEGIAKYKVACVPENRWDYFHEILITDELSRCASGGVVWNLLGGFGIGTIPVLRFGNDELVKRVMPGILAGEKRICLAITEPDGGSDVANLGCEAKLSEDGQHLIVNGEKKWITNGVWADYFTTAVRTGKPGFNGISMILVEKTMPGVSVRRMDCQGVWSSGTTYVTYEDVKVPIGNVLGKLNKGFPIIMANFNHERIGIIIQCIRFSRICYEDAMKYAHKRKTFGKRLIDHPVIRLKFAHMARQIEATWAWLENMVYQCTKMDEAEAMLKLGGAIAGLKAQSTTTFEFCAREASQIFGGLSYSRGGQGGRVERLYRDVRAYAIPGGSEEIMLDLSIRQSLKVHEVLGMKI